LKEGGKPLTGPSFQERRYKKRIIFKEPVQFQTKAFDEWAGTVGGDLSSGGMRLNFYDFVPLNTELNLQIRLAPEKIVNCSGRLVWIVKMRYMERYQGGVEFQESGENAPAKQEIEKFLTST
jgi:hypothetical protein